MLLLVAPLLLSAPLAPAEEVPTGAVLVLVRDAGGRPVEGASVSTRSMRREQEPPRDGELRPSGSGWLSAPRRSDERGRVLLTDLSPDRVRVAAGGSPRWVWTHSEPLAAGPEEPGRVVELRLEPPPRERLIGGSVRSADGSPAARICVRLYEDRGGAKRKQTTWTGPDGRFLFLLEHEDAVGALLVAGRGVRASGLVGVLGGTTDVELRAVEPPTFAVDVRGRGGAPVEHTSVHLWWRIAGEHVDGSQARHEDGRWELPALPFDLSVSAWGFEPSRLAACDPESVGERVVVELEPLPRLRGRVTHEGVGVAAEVWVELAAAPALEADWDSLSSPGPARHRSWAREDGSFELAIAEPGRYRLRAWSAELGAGRLEGVMVHPDADAEGLELRLTDAPGSVEGRVRMPPGRSAEEIWLVPTAGPGKVPVAADGTFRMSDLRPGTSRIQVVGGLAARWAPPSTSARGEKGRLPLSNGFSRAPEWLSFQPSFPVQVRSGERASVELDLATPMPCLLVGRVAIDGAPPRLAPRPSTIVCGEIAPGIVLDRGDRLDWTARTELDAQGRFTLGAVEPGEYRLSLELVLTDGSRWIVRDRVRLVEGPAPWELDLATGSLVVGPSAASGGRAFGGHARWEGPGWLRVFAPWGTEEPGSPLARRFPRLPAGTIRLLTRWSEPAMLATLRIEAGETTTWP